MLCHLGWLMHLLYKYGKHCFNKFSIIQEIRREKPKTPCKGKSIEAERFCPYRAIW